MVNLIQTRRYLHISKTTRARKLKLRIQLDMPKYLFGYKKVYARGHPEGAAPFNVNLGPPQYLVKY